MLWLDVLDGGGLAAFDVDLASWGLDVHGRISSHMDLLAGSSDVNISFVHHDPGLAGMNLDPCCVDSGVDVLLVAIELDLGLRLLDGEVRLAHVDLRMGLPDGYINLGAVEGRDILLLNDDFGDGWSDLEGLMLGHVALGIFRVIDDLRHSDLEANDSAVIRVRRVAGV